MDIQRMIDERPMTPTQLVIVFTCFVLNMLDGMDVVVASYVAPRIMEEWAVSPQSFGLVFSSALFGMASGAMFISPYTDIIGRRALVLAAIALVTAGMFATSFAETVPQLILLRFLTGLGIGTMLASLTSLASEYSSDRRRNLVIGFVLSGYPVGATCTGLLAAWLIPEFGWRSMFIAGGAISLLMLPVVAALLPESLEFLLSRRPAGALEKANAILRRMQYPGLDSLPPADTAAGPAPGGTLYGNVSALLSADRRADTIKLWTAFFMAFFTLYFLFSWIPKIAEDTGLTPVQGSYAGAIFNFGSFFGIVLLGHLSNAFGLKRIIFLFMILSAALMLVFGLFRFPAAGFMLVLFVLGFFVQGGFVGLYSVAARMYPIGIRTTGIGWGIGLGRFGAIISPALGGIAIGLKLPVAVIFILFAAPYVLAAYAEKGIKSGEIN